MSGASAQTIIVLDASVTAAWLLPDERTTEAERVYARVRRGDFACHAPDFWLTECGNMIASAVRRSRMSTADALLTWSVLEAIHSRVSLTNLLPSQLKAVLTVALEHTLSMYDATYLWLARSLKSPLLTHDRRLAAAAAQAGGPKALSFKDLA